MSTMGLYAIMPKSKYKSSKGDMNRIVNNLLLEKVIDEDNHRIYYEKNFNITKFNEIWSTDVS